MKVSQADPGDPQTVIWLLDRVMDQWGNYYDINYNGDGQGDALATGIRVTEIVYTMNPQNGFIVPRRIFFAYEPQERPDVRRLRFGKFTLPRNRRLSSITTPQGTYSLAYKPDDDLMLPSRLASINYCVSASPPECTPEHPCCVQPLEFDWEGGGYGWVGTPIEDPPRVPTGYDHPSRVNSRI